MQIRITGAATAALVASTAFANPGIIWPPSQTSSYSDAANDIANGIATGGGTLDLLGMEVSHTATDLVFSLRVNGNVTGSGSVDWGKFMIGIATGNGSGTTSGNGWGRPINMSAPNGGMTHWVGSWVDGGGGSQLWTHGNGSWSGPAGLSGFAFAGNTITYTVSMASLGLSMGDTFYFDAYSSGGGGGDGAIDALANPNVSVQGWGDSYTSSAPNIFSYTIPAPGALALLGVAGIAAGRRIRKA
jgi:hypothetical protein